MSGWPLAPAPPCPWPPPGATPVPPLAAPSPPRLGFAFSGTGCCGVFCLFWGLLSSPRISCVRVWNIALYNVSGGRGQSPEEQDGGWGPPRCCPAWGARARAPHPHACPHTPPPSSGPNMGAAGLQGAFGTIHSPPPYPKHPLPALRAPGGPTRPRPPHVTLGQVFSLQHDPCGGAGAARTPMVPLAMPPLGHLHPNPMPA